MVSRVKSLFPGWGRDQRDKDTQIETCAKATLAVPQRHRMMLPFMEQSIAHVDSGNIYRMMDPYGLH